MSIICLVAITIMYNKRMHIIYKFREDEVVKLYMERGLQILLVMGVYSNNNLIARACSI